MSAPPSGPRVEHPHDPEFVLTAALDAPGGAAAAAVVESAPVQVLVLQAAGERVAIALDRVVEIKRHHAPAPIPGAPPDLAELPPGCAFAPRCTIAADGCRSTQPAAERIAAGHEARCLRIDEAARIAPTRVG